MKEVKPIRPEEIVKPIPDTVIEAFNELITKNFNGTSSEFLASDVVNLIVKRKACRRTEIYSSGYLDVEPIYRKNGWQVDYEQPSIGDNFSAYFRFIKKPL